jgi:hypothetical protein
MIISSTPAAGTNAARRISISIGTAILVAALVGCGGGGGDRAGSGTIATGASVNSQGIGPSSSTAWVAEAPVRVHAATAGRQQLLAVGAMQAGGHGVAWLSQDGGNATVQLRRYDTQGQAVGSDVMVGVDPLEGNPAAAVLADGSLVVASAIAGPASVDEPWVTLSAIRVQRFDAAGNAAGDVDIGAVRQNRIGATTMRYVSDPAVIRWDHGGFLVGWALVEEDANGRSPQFWVQRFGAGGQPVGAPSLAAPGERDSGFQLTGTPNGGWLLTTFHRTMGRTFLRYHPFEGASAPALPAGATGMAEGSLLVPLQGGGSVLLQPAKVYGSVQLYGSDGQAQGPAGALPTVPLAAAALRDGGFVVFTTGASQLVGQRFDASGNPVGQTVPVDASADLQGAALADGGLAIGWTATQPSGDTDVMAQRLR